MMLTLQLKVKDTLKFQTMVANYGEAYVMIILRLKTLMFFAIFAVAVQGETQFPHQLRSNTCQAVLIQIQNTNKYRPGHQVEVLPEGTEEMR